MEAAVAAPAVALLAVVRLAGTFLVVDFEGAALEAVGFGDAFLDPADFFDPAACVFAVFAGALPVRAAFLGAPAGGVVSGAVTRAS
ncbi:MAG TPA: hypothetical protein VK773_10315 [Acidimicrobiales bacterium]|nr:hypothetical protein [Acidimicrobiales bacterium]